MLKKDEIANPQSCLNRAADDEPLFVLRAVDVCAPDLIRLWCNERIIKRKNTITDSQIKEAMELADAMELWRHRQAMLGNVKA